jgi:DNA-binding MarR family transcriptional regulator
MGEVLKRRLKQSRFEGPHQEAMLSLLVASSFLEELFDSICEDFGISRQQYNILRILRGAGEQGHPCGEISTRMLDRSPDVTRRIDGLVKLGLVERQRSAEDRRVVISKITPSGMELLERMSPREKEYLGQVKRRLSVKQAQELTVLCERLFSDET